MSFIMTCVRREIYVLGTAIESGLLDFVNCFVWLLFEAISNPSKARVQVQKPGSMNTT